MAITHSDGELVTAALVGGREAFDELIARHQEQVFRIALGRLRDPDAAQDAVQDTFVKAYLNLSSLHQPSAFGAWVGQIATGTALDARRRTKHHLPHDDAPAAGEDVDPAARVEVGPARTALRALPRTSRLVVILHHLNGYSHAEIGAMLGLTPGAVKVHLSRARERLRKELTAMVTETLEVTRLLYACTITVHGIRAGWATATATEGTRSPEWRLRGAGDTYSWACLDADLAEHPAWAAQREAAALGALRAFLEDGLASGATGVRLYRERDGETKLRATYTGTDANWDATSDQGWDPLCRRIATTIGLPQEAPALGTGWFRYEYAGRACLLRATLGEDEVELAIDASARGRQATLLPEPEAPAGRLARAVVAQAMADGATALRAHLRKQRSEFTIEYQIGEEWQQLVRCRAEQWTPTEDGKMGPSRPVDQPLWLPFQRAVMAMAGSELRPNTRRQSGRFRLTEGKDTAEIRVTATPTTLRWLLHE